MTAGELNASLLGPTWTASRIASVWRWTVDCDSVSITSSRWITSKESEIRHFQNSYFNRVKFSERNYLDYRETYKESINLKSHRRADVMIEIYIFLFNLIRMEEERKKFNYFPWTEEGMEKKVGCKSGRPKWIPLLACPLLVFFTTNFLSNKSQIHPRRKPKRDTKGNKTYLLNVDTFVWSRNHSTVRHVSKFT